MRDDADYPGPGPATGFPDHPAPPAGFKQLLGLTELYAADGQADLLLPFKAELANHVGGPHAAVIFALGETAAGSVVKTAFADLLADGVMLIKSGRIRYYAVAAGGLLARARLPSRVDPAAVRAAYDRRGMTVFEVDVAFLTESDSIVTGEMTAEMAIKRSAGERSAGDKERM
jgi:acyl-coenzyme A thioesterase PaaI-like protein